MAVPRQWASLHIDMVTVEIVSRLPCAIDRARMAAVCQAWLRAVEQAPPPPPRRLPSLLLAPADATGVYCYLSGCRDHTRFPGPRHFGSYDGAWLFLAYGQTREHRLLNVRTGEYHELPYMLAVADGTHPMAILAAILSYPPRHPQCVAAGIVTYQPGLDAPRRRHFAFWRPGDEMALCPAAPVGPGLEQEDVVHFLHSFHFLTQGGDILVCRPVLDMDRNGEIASVTLGLFRFNKAEGTDEQQLVVRARYLVASRGELLMVVRLAPHHHAPTTSSFKVFQMTRTSAIKPEEEEAGVYPWTWSKLHALGGRMLFVGRGCSRSYEVAQYPGFKDGIFFLDDRSFYDESAMSIRGSTPAATSAGGRGRRKGRLPTSTSTSRSRFLRTTLLQFGSSPETAAGLWLRNL